jgi:hypothetical protein
VLTTSSSGAKCHQTLNRCLVISRPMTHLLGAGREINSARHPSPVLMTAGTTGCPRPVIAVVTIRKSYELINLPQNSSPPQG